MNRPLLYRDLRFLPVLILTILSPSGSSFADDPSLYPPEQNSTAIDADDRASNEAIGAAEGTEIISEIRRHIEEEQAELERFTPKTQWVHLILNAIPNWTPAEQMKAQANRAEKAEPGSTRIVNIEASNDFLKAIQPQSGDEQIISLYVNSHGKSSPPAPVAYAKKECTATDQYCEATFGLPKSLLSISNIQASVAALPAPTKPRFAPGAWLVSTGCKIIPEIKQESDVLRTLNSFRLMRNAFGLRSGWIYGNYTTGTQARDYVSTPFYRYSNVGKGVLIGLTQAVYPLSLGVANVIDKDLGMNRGYVYGFANGKEVLFKSNFFDARKGNADLENPGEILFGHSE